MDENFEDEQYEVWLMAQEEEAIERAIADGEICECCHSTVCGYSEPDCEPDDYYEPDEWQVAQNRYEAAMFRD